MSPTNDSIREFLQQYAPELRLVLAPAAERLLRSREDAVPEGALLQRATDTNGDGPGILLLTPEDLSGPHRPTLMRLAATLHPGRPLLIGGTRDRAVLLDAINQWRIARVLPQDASDRTVRTAVEQLHEAMTVEIALHHAAVELRVETDKLERAIGELREAQEQLLHTERLTTMGRIADGLIAAIRQHLHALDRFEAAVRPQCDEELLDMLEHAFEGMRSIGTLLDEIHAYAESRERSYDIQAAPLDDLVRRAVTFIRFDDLGRARILETTLSSGALVQVDRHRLYQVLINLLRNAFQATSEGDTVRVATRLDGATAVIDVQDEGSGMSEEVKARIFEPFFTTKGERGMGLGLSVSRAAIERQGGHISCESAPGRGTIFRIALPQSPDPS